jgi:hypothetical protein
MRRLQRERPDLAIGLVEAGRRENGRFTRGSVPDNPGSGVIRKNWAERVREAGLVLDHAPELADGARLTHTRAS